jgi:hypothetical protein
MAHRIVRLCPGDERLVIAAAELFDDDPTPEWTERFLNAPGHHLYIAYIDDAPALGFAGRRVLRSKLPVGRRS